MGAAGRAHRATAEVEFNDEVRGLGRFGGVGEGEDGGVDAGFGEG